MTAETAVPSLGPRYCTPLDVRFLNEHPNVQSADYTVARASILGCVMMVWDRYLLFCALGSFT